MYYKHGHSIGNKHGFPVSPEYTSWQQMKDRCYNKNAAGYKRYGGRGIKVCKYWYDDFISFVKDMGRRPTRLHTLERVDNSKDYIPSNCKWATRKEQSHNRRSSVVTQQDVNDIRRDYATGLYSQRVLAEIYDISQQHVSSLVRRTRWA
jgi:hypothetical protein